ncbi:hypothetical protein C8J48_3274 [Desmospora activa DSM 45169]|uniref:Uncharacterized protein n=1 Tax=Desmospora activa DSM 45169 TaxID=1121389 RepID=A0A2T4Z4X4_9BACL|nr:hypothetical protein C8J48_3274 [Desmospora activa DSM 45169]
MMFSPFYIPPWMVYTRSTFYFGPFYFYPWWKNNPPIDPDIPEGPLRPPEGPLRPEL